MSSHELLHRTKIAAKIIKRKVFNSLCSRGRFHFHSYSVAGALGPWSLRSQLETADRRSGTQKLEARMKAEQIRQQQWEEEAVQEAEDMRYPYSDVAQRVSDRGREWLASLLWYSFRPIMNPCCAKVPDSDRMV